jgi:hypothetical protein
MQHCSKQGEAVIYTHSGIRHGKHSSCDHERYVLSIPLQSCKQPVRGTDHELLLVSSGPIGGSLIDFIMASVGAVAWALHAHVSLRGAIGSRADELHLSGMCQRMSDGEH